MFFRRETFDPYKISAQIFLLQSLFYITNGLVLLLMALVVGPSHICLFNLLAPQAISFAYSEGMVPAMAALASTPFLSFCIANVVKRAKKCLDFSATVFLVHLIISCLYAGWPSSGSWWVTHLTAFAATAFQSEFIAIRNEMQLIPVSDEDEGLELV